MQTIKLWIYLGVAGVAAIASGLIVDARLHAHDHTLAAREGVFALGNPGHVLLGVGIALVTLALGGLVVLTHLRPQLPSRST